MALPSGPIKNEPDYRLEIASINELDELMKVYMEVGETATYKGHMFVKFINLGDDRYIPIGTFTAGADFPVLADFDDLVEVGSMTIANMLGEPGETNGDIIKRFLNNGGITEPPAPLEVHIELGTPNNQRNLTGQMFVKYTDTHYKKLNDYDFVVASLEKPEVYAGDLSNLFDVNHVDSRFITDFSERNT